MTHTPGPWSTEMWPNQKWVHRVWASLPTGKFGVADTHNPRLDSAEVAANARLVAAAPEMLEALQAALELRGYAAEAATQPYETGTGASADRECQAIEDLIRAAIAKATTP